MTSRRDFFKGTAASLSLLIAAKLGHSDPDVPRQADARKGFTDVRIVVHHGGRELKHVVAYDLDRDWALTLALDHRGQRYLVGGDFAYREHHGGITVQWDRRV